MSRVLCGSWVIAKKGTADSGCRGFEGKSILTGIPKGYQNNYVRPGSGRMNSGPGEFGIQF